MNSIALKDVPSDKKVYTLLQHGLVERGSMYVGMGLAAGAVASIVLTRGSAAKKVITAFGGGVGLGSAWTRTSMDLEEILEAKSEK